MVITDSLLSPVAAHATVCLEVHDAELHNFRSLTASMFLAQERRFGLIGDSLPAKAAADFYDTFDEPAQMA
ncbi:MAG: hypothetical protein PF501_11560 [Salinisphaera sp.]|nr:hypothetical protein [Salinisphaera sp.]